jgi:hypothetical protein
MGIGRPIQRPGRSAENRLKKAADRIDLLGMSLQPRINRWLRRRRIAPPIFWFGAIFLIGAAGRIAWVAVRG